MAKDKKSKVAEKKARAAAKQSKKVAKGEKKVKAKATKDADSDTDENTDLDAVLAAYAAEQAKFLKVTEAASPTPPSARASSTIVASPSNRNELFIFGGEYYDGTVASFFNDLFVYLIDRGEWRRITSPNSPLPRSGHAWCRGGNTGGIYLFGGEFSSPKQGTFYHYNDFWHLDTNSREWTRIETKGKGGSPPARSGHRMTYFKNYILLFGGFQDTSQQTKYLQDLWIYDCKENTWTEPKLASGGQRPDARSSLSLLPHESGAVIYGGYSRVKTVAVSGKKGKGGAQRSVLKPVVHQDTWFLRIALPATDAPSSTAPAVKWERRKRPANAPNPARAGATMAYHKGRGVMFGGVHDVEESEEGIDSEFFSDLFIWNVDRNRFVPLALRRPRAGTASRKSAAASSRTKDRGKADEEELLRNLAALEAKGSIADAEDIDMMSGQEPSSDMDFEKPELIVRWEMPHRRFNAQATVQDDTFFIFGGTFERGDLEFTFSDMFSIDLNKLDGVREIFYSEPINWNATGDDDTDEEDEDEDGDDSDDGSDDDDEMSIDAHSTAAATFTEISAKSKEPDVVVDIEVEKTALGDDHKPYPRPFENLRDFFSRTSIEWQMLVGKDDAQATEQSVKYLRRKAFDASEERWWDCREEIRALEDEQEAAGIGDVVSIADRAAGDGAGRRR